jgi:hypothetical protein
MENTVEDPGFVAIPLSKINPEEPLCADTYLRIAEKHIKYKEKGDAISAETYDLFLSKNVSTTFITEEGRDEFAACLD